MEEENNEKKDTSKELLINIYDVLNDIDLEELDDVKKKILVRKAEIEKSKSNSR